MTWKKTAVGAAAALAAVALLAGFRGGCGRGHGPGHDPAEVQAFVDSQLEDLDATPAQSAQVKQIVDRVIADAQKLHEGQRDGHAALLEQWNAATPDRAKVHALVDARIDAVRAFAHEAADAAVDVHGVLTPEQRAKVAKKIERHHR